MNERQSRVHVIVTAGLAAGAFALFARLALRHVGESYFLADQVDQLQKFEALLRLDPEGLWGPEMSGTTAHALGPFGALVFGVPVTLGFGIDAIHAFTSLLLVVAAALAFWQLARLDVALAWVWLIVFTAMRLVWWNAAMFWVNTTLLPLGLLLLALFAASVRKPSLLTLAAIALVQTLALQQHLIAIVGLPVLLQAFALFVARRAVPADEPGDTTNALVPGGERRSPACALAVIAVVVAAGMLPYAIAEGRTGLRNTRAMLSQVDAAVHSSSGEGLRAAVETLVLAANPVLMGADARPLVSLAAGGLVVLAALAVSWIIRRGATAMALLWLVVAATVCVAGQALFFLLMARPIQGLHYAMLLAPWYPIPVAGLVAALLRRRGVAATIVSATLGVMAIVLLIVRAPALADRHAERTPWTYKAIVAALDTLCAGQPVGTIEGPGLVDDLTPSYDSVFRYVMKRGYSRCRYDENADILIVAPRTGVFDESIEAGGRRFVKELVLEPGIARYRANDP